MFHGRGAKSRTEGPNFRFFDFEDASKSFDAMKAPHGSFRMLSNMLTRAFSLDDDLVYGGAYFSAERTIALLKVVRELAQDLPR